MSNAVDIEGVTLDRVRFEIMQAISLQAIKSLQGVDIDVDISANPYIKFVADHFEIRLRATLLSDTLAHETVIYPADWKEAVKERWLPAWVKRRWPVRYKSHIFDAKALYPSMRVFGDNVPVMWSQIQVRTQYDDGDG